MEGLFLLIYLFSQAVISDREIVLRSEFLNPCLWEVAVLMANRGFTVQDLFEPLGVKAIIIF